MLRSPEIHEESRRKLLRLAKIRVRKTAVNILDEDIEQLADAAETDIKRIGVSEDLFFDYSDALIRETILTYIKANYGDHPDRDKLMESYHLHIIKIKGDSKYFG